MKEYRLGEIEARFADLIWTNEPVTSAELVKLAERELQWKKSTTYTVLRRLIEKGFFQNQNSIVTSLLTREELAVAQSEQLIDESFAGSLPLFLTAFANRKKLTAKDIEEIQKLIDENRG